MTMRYITGKQDKQLECVKIQLAKMK